MTSTSLEFVKVLVLFSVVTSTLGSRIRGFPTNALSVDSDDDVNFEIRSESESDIDEFSIKSESERTSRFEIESDLSSARPQTRKIHFGRLAPRNTPGIRPEPPNIPKPKHNIFKKRHKNMLEMSEKHHENNLPLLKQVINDKKQLSFSCGKEKISFYVGAILESKISSSTGKGITNAPNIVEMEGMRIKMTGHPTRISENEWVIGYELNKKCPVIATL